MRPGLHPDGPFFTVGDTAVFDPEQRNGNAEFIAIAKGGDSDIGIVAKTQQVAAEIFVGIGIKTRQKYSAFAKPISGYLQGTLLQILFTTGTELNFIFAQAKPGLLIIGINRQIIIIPATVAQADMYFPI